jgi:hypothetical protein
MLAEARVPPVATAGWPVPLAEIIVSRRVSKMTKSQVNMTSVNRCLFDPPVGRDCGLHATALIGEEPGNLGQVAQAIPWTRD